MKPYDWEADCFGCWWLARAIQRERLVRQGMVKPRNNSERRQAKEGDRPEKDYDAVREAADG